MVSKKADKVFFFQNRWESIGLIGEGSYGKVYKARPTKNKGNDISAIKNIVIKKSKQDVDNLVAEGLSQDEIIEEVNEVLEKCISEIKLMQRLKGSSNIVVIEDYEIIKNKDGLGGEINIRMELLESLEKYYKGKKITNRDIIKLGIDISHALRDCETVKIIHRDIKPDNIIVNEFGQYKLGDFGIARNLEKTTTGLSQKGTFNYIAPEVYKGNRYNRSVDVYSLGIVLYKYFNYNRLPFFPEYPNRIRLDDREEALIRRCDGERIVKPVNASEKESKVILKMLEYDPKDRYTNINELIDDLESLLDEDLREIPFPEKEVSQNTLKTDNNKIKKNKVSFRKIKKMALFIIPIIFLVLSLTFGLLYYNNNYVEIPYVIGKNSSTAVRLLDKAKLKNKIKYITVENEDSIGKVIRQNLKNKKIKKWSVIKITVGLSTEKVLVPNVVGLSKDKAKNELENVKLGVSFVEEYSDTVSKDIVISQMTKDGTKVGKGTVIEVLISKGKKEEEKREEEKNSKDSSEEVSSHSSSEKNASKDTKDKNTKTAVSSPSPSPKAPATPAPTPVSTPAPVYAKSMYITYVSKCADNGATKSLRVGFTPSNASDADSLRSRVVWSSSNSSVANVDSNGNVTFKGSYYRQTSATVTASIPGTSFSDSKTFYVNRVGIVKDLDGNGRIDANDAATLVEMIKEGSTIVYKHDYTGDKVVDQNDVDHLLNLFKTEGC